MNTVDSIPERNREICVGGFGKISVKIYKAITHKWWSGIAPPPPQRECAEPWAQGPSERPPKRGVRANKFDGYLLNSTSVGCEGGVQVVLRLLVGIRQGSVLVGVSWGGQNSPLEPKRNPRILMGVSWGETYSCWLDKLRNVFFQSKK